MIQLKNLERSYKTPAGQTWVLRRINLDIREGEFITIMGPSGAGKSSLLNVLALLDDSWEGEYWFREQAVHDMKRKQRAELAKKNIGMVFQSYHLLDDLTVQENIDLPLSYKDIPRRERQSLGCRHARPLSDRRQERSLSQPALRRTATACRNRPRSHSQAAATARRRTYRQSSFHSGQRNHGTLPRSESARNHDRASHALGSECRLWKPHHSTAGWLDGRRHRESCAQQPAEVSAS